MEKVVIIGTGCAGLTAAIYAARFQSFATGADRPDAGQGLLTTTSIVENYPGFPEGVDGHELMMRMQEAGRAFRRACQDFGSGGGG